MNDILKILDFLIYFYPILSGILDQEYKLWNAALNHHP